MIDLMLGFVMLLVLLSFFFRKRFALHQAKKQALAVATSDGEVSING